MGKEGRPTQYDDALDAWFLTARKLMPEIGWSQVDRVLLGGSVRRERPVVSDVDVLVVLDDDTKPLSVLEPLDWAERYRLTEKQGWVEVNGVRIELWKCPKDSIGPMWQFLTGPASLNVWLRKRAIRMGMKLSQYGLVCPDGSRVDVTSGFVAEQLERSVFDALEVEWMEPTQRDDWNRIVASASGPI